MNARTVKRYRDHAVTLRQVAMENVVSHKNRAYLRSCADNCDKLAATIENGVTETALQTCRRMGTVMDEIDTWHTAGSLMTQFGDVAGATVALYADSLFIKDDHLGFAIWTRVGRAIEELQRQKPHEGEAMN